MHICLNASPPKQSQLDLSDTMEGHTLQHESKTDIKRVNGTFLYCSVAIFSSISGQCATV